MNRYIKEYIKDFLFIYYDIEKIIGVNWKTKKLTN